MAQDPDSPSSFLPCGLITLTTDFGTADGYVGAMKGRILSYAPDLRVEDLAHDIPAQNVIHGASSLAAAAPYWPPGTVHVAVIDPGVGTARRALAAVAGGQCFVGPDNGLFAPALAHLGNARSHEITRNPSTNSFLAEDPAPTFHGRDLFAPIGAGLASGKLTLEDIGPACTPAPLDQPAPVKQGNHLEGQIVVFDHFGNAITNLRREDLLDGTVVAVSAGETSVALHRTYAEVDPGEPLALIGSSGFVEIAVRNGHAGRTLGLKNGDKVRVQDRKRSENTPL